MKVFHENCHMCGACFVDKNVVCPGTKLSKNTQKIIKKFNDPIIGEILCSFIGKSTNKSIYTNSQSGGLVTSVLTSSMKSGYVGGAIVTVMDYGNPPKSKPVFLTSSKKLEKSQGSKYYPTPVLDALKLIKNVKKPIIMVGLPCHFHGLYNLFEKVKWLRKKKIYKIGLICESNLRADVIQHFVGEKNIDDDYVVKYRDKSVGGYPGGVSIITKSGKRIVEHNRSVRKKAKKKYSINRCKTCYDKFNVLADIVFGDPWGMKYDDDGESVVMIRNNSGKSLLSMSKDIKIRKANTNDVLRGQKIKKVRKIYENQNRRYNKK